MLPACDVLRWLRGEIYPRDSLDRLCRLFQCRQALQPFSVLLEQMWTNQLDRLAELAEAAEPERPR